MIFYFSSRQIFFTSFVRRLHAQFWVFAIVGARGVSFQKSNVASQVEFRIRPTNCRRILRDINHGGAYLPPTKLWRRNKFEASTDREIGQKPLVVQASITHLPRRHYNRWRQPIAHTNEKCLFIACHAWRVLALVLDLCFSSLYPRNTWIHAQDG